MEYWQEIKPHMGYPWFYRTNLEELKGRVDDMTPTRDDVQSSVERAHRSGDTIRRDAPKWLEDFQRLKGRTDEMGNEAAHVRPWHLGARYSLGKRASEEMGSVEDLRKRAKYLLAPGVSFPPPPPTIHSYLPNDGFQEFKTTKLCIERVMEELERESVSLISVHGMGGAGKTSLIKKVTKKAKSEGLFDEVVFAVVSRDVNVKKIQQHIAELLGIKFEVEETELARAAKIEKQLMNKRTLVVLDDLWERLVLSEIGIPDCCKVVITTRNENLGSRMSRSQAVNIPLGILLEDEAWKLFTLTLGDLTVAEPAVQVLARDVARKCGGLPLALTVMGRAMRGKHDKDEWKDVLEDLRKATPFLIEGMQNEVYNVIRYSFDHLSNEELKLCFLFCCLLPEDFSVQLCYCYPFEHPSYYYGREIYLSVFTSYARGDGFLVNETDTLVTAESHVRRLLRKLKDCGLLLEGDIEKESVKMHDVVRDAAIQISSDVYGFYSRAGTDLDQWPRVIHNLDTRQRISLMYNKIDHSSLPDKVVCPNLLTLILRGNGYLKRLPDGFFEALEALRVLDLSQAGLESIPASLSSLTNLRVLFLEIAGSCDGLSSVGCLKKLEILSIRSRSYSSFSIPKEIAELTSLRCLDLTGCRGRIPGGVISRLSSLEQLCLLNGFDEWQVQGGSGDVDLASFTELARLKHLTRLYVTVKNKECLTSHAFSSPEPLIWPNLIEFQIDAGVSRFVPSDESTSLSLKGTIAINNWVKELMTRTKDLSLRDCEGIECLVSTVEGDIPPSTFPVLLRLQQVFHYQGMPAGGQAPLLPELKKLQLIGLPQLTTIWEGDAPEGSLQGLEYLRIEKCDRLKCVVSPALARAHAYKKLQKLEINFCEQLESIIMWPGTVSVLKTHEVFSCLQMLIVSYCDRLTRLFSWREAQGLQQLEELYLEKCGMLECVIMSEVGDEALMAVMDDKVALLPQLKKLVLSDLAVLSSFHQGIPASIYLSSLEDFSICNCPQFGKLTLEPNSLKHITVSNSSKNFRFMSSDVLFGPQLLHKLTIKGLDELQEVFHYNSMIGGQGAPLLCDGDVPDGCVPNLEELEISNCGHLRFVLSPALVRAHAFGQLKSLEIVGCNQLEQIVSDTDMVGNQASGILSVLEVLTVEDCGCLTSLFSWKLARGLQKLQKLTIRNCCALKELIVPEESENQAVDDKNLLPELRELLLSNLPVLSSFIGGSHCTNSLRSLRSITIRYCPELRKLPLGPGSTQLQILKIAGCNQLEQIVPDTDMVANQASGILSILQELAVEGCGCLTSLFSWKLARGLQKLQWLTISNCCALKELIVPEEPENQAMDDKSLLPELRELSLSNLPVLSSFIGGSHCTISLPSLRKITIEDCPELRKLPLGPGSIIEEIRASKEWFESLQLEDQSTKSRLRQALRPLRLWEF